MSSLGAGDCCEKTKRELAAVANEDDIEYMLAPQEIKVYMWCLLNHLCDKLDHSLYI